MAKHGKEALSNDEGEEQVDSDGDRLARWSDLQREALTWNQPPKRSPWPCKCPHIEADEAQKHICKDFWHCPRASNAEFQA